MIWVDGPADRDAGDGAREGGAIGPVYIQLRAVNKARRKMSINQFSAVVVALLLSAHSSHAMEIKCLDSKVGTRVILRPNEKTPFPRLEEIPQCLHAELSGKIESGDATRVSRFLDEQQHLYNLYLQSPGGNVVDAIQIGRMIRQRFLRTTAHPYSETGRSSEFKCGTQGKPVCCASACALSYFGGVQWFVGDRLGLHRPTLEDLGDYDYAEAQEHMRRGATLIKNYLEEMEIDEHVYAAMMGTPSNAVSVWEIDPSPKRTVDDFWRYPKSVNDWLFAKCRRMGDRPREGCMSDELRKETDRRADDQNFPNEEAKQFDNMTIAELRTFLRSANVKLFSRINATKRLEQLRLEQDRRAIDKMDVCEVKEYMDARFGDDQKLTDGEGMTMRRAIERLEALTGDPEPWSKRNRTPEGCPQYRSRF
jgi:hypothetical protein